MYSQRNKTPTSKTASYEFMGPVGTFFMTLGLPMVVLALYIFCNPDQCSLSIPSSFPNLWKDFWHPHAYSMFIAWFLFHAVIYMSPLGRTVKGSKLREGSHLSYRINGIHAFVISHFVFIIGYFYLKLPVTIVYEKFLPLASAAFVFSFALAVYLYAKSFNEGALLAKGGNSSYVLYDWFLGRELNPRIGSFDWKYFCELRPGLIGWVFINYCMMAKQYEIHGTVTASMILVCFFQFWYVLDALWFEEAILTTMDIVHDGFGFMLAFGDLCWVPFTYSLQARFLVNHPTELSIYAIVGILVIKFIGYSIFRLSNNQKDLFRRDSTHPSLKHLKTLQTMRGTRLIVSGWWGICRHPNYVGDLIMALSWSLPCGVSHVIPYFYFIYFFILLIHRQLRDEHQCCVKYGRDWDQYCRLVKWRLIPYLY